VGTKTEKELFTSSKLNNIAVSTQVLKLRLFSEVRKVNVKKLK
jgi:hypothetical protein